MASRPAAPPPRHGGMPGAYAQPAPDAPAPAIAIESLRVERDRVRACVRVADPAWRQTTPALAQAAAAARPNLPRHACVNGEGPTFGAVAAHTALPHLLEHLAIDLQAAACPDAARVFTGATRWTDRAAGRAQVEVSYADDLQALRAFRDATALVNALVARVRM